VVVLVFILQLPLKVETISIVIVTFQEES